MAGDWPLVGRSADLVAVAEALGCADRAGIVLAGAAGVGKTRLAREALVQASAARRPTAWAAATPSARQVPFGAFAHLLPAELPPMPTVANLLRAAGEALLTESGAVTGGGRLVVGIDDAHLLDDTSAALIHHLAVSGRTGVVITVRSGEPVPGSVAALWKEGLAARHEVAPLSRADVKQLVAAVLGGTVPAATLHRLWMASQGNPLMLHELVVEGRQAGLLVERGGVWRWDGSAAALPRLRELVEGRIGQLDPDERAALELVAFGEPLEASVLRQVAAVPAVERLERRGLIAGALEGRRAHVRLSHPIYGDSVRASTRLLRARAVRAVLASAVEGTGARRREDVLRLAAWRLDAGLAGRPELLTKGARQALTMFDYRLAERLGRAAIAASGGFEARLALAEAIIGVGRSEAAEHLLAEMEATAASGIERARAAAQRADNLFWGLGRGASALQVVKEAMVTVEDASWRDRLRASRALVLSFGEDIRAGLSAAQELLNLPETAAPIRVVAATVATLGLLATGRTADAVRLADRILPLARELAGRSVPEFAPLWLQANQCLALALGGRITEAVTRFGPLYDEAVGHDLGPVRGALGFCFSPFLELHGQPRSAATVLREAAVLLREVDLYRHLAGCMGQLARCLGLLGDPAEAEAALAEAEAALVPSFRLDESFVGLGRAWTLAARGELSAGARQARRTAQRCAELGQVMFAALALHDVARLGQPAEAAEALAVVGSGVDGELVPAFAAHASAAAAGDAAGLEDAACTFERMGAVLLAAEAAAEAAHAHRRANRPTAAGAWAARTHELAVRCEGARTPALALAGAALPLTRRQREIAAMAVAGLTNRAIAQRLGVSSRTVDNHLYAVYTQLGVHRRDELTPLLAPRWAAPDPSKRAALGL